MALTMIAQYKMAFGIIIMEKITKEKMFLLEMIREAFKEKKVLKKKILKKKIIEKKSSRDEGSRKESLVKR